MAYKIINENGIPEIMSRNRFEKLISMIYVSNNEQYTDSEDFSKTSRFLDMQGKKLKESYIPQELVSMVRKNVPNRRCSYFRQYNLNRIHTVGTVHMGSKRCISGRYNFVVQSLDWR